jgi:CheY-like chemotaxis protein
VLDLLMPEMDGLAFLDQLRQVDEGRTPVIVWTAKDLSVAERTRLTDAAKAIVQKGPAGAGLVAELRMALAVSGDAA